MGALQYVDTPGYAALLLRKTYTELAMSGGLLDRSHEWLKNTDAHWNGTDKTWTFPSGARLSFGYLKTEEDRYRYRSSEFQYIGFDELTDFGENSYRFLFTRLRKKAGVSIPLRMRSASNPGGKGHLWCKKRFISHRAPGTIFIPAKLADNPGCDQESYLRSLAEVDPITRRHILDGNWDAIEGGRFLAGWFNRRFRTGTDFYQLGERNIDFKRCPRFGTCDPAASSLETAKGDDPDYTVVCAWATTPLNELIWLHCERFRKEIPDIVPEIQKVYDKWNLQFVDIEAVAANRAVAQLAKRTKMAVREVSPMGLDKLVRATPAMVIAESGRLWLPEAAPWIDDALAELLLFTGDDKKDAHDDCVDNLSYGAQRMLKKDQQAGFKPYVVGRRA